MGWLSMADLLSAPAVAWIFLQVREFSGGRDLDTPGAACVLRGAVGWEGEERSRAGSAARQAMLAPPPNLARPPSDSPPPLACSPTRPQP